MLGGCGGIILAGGKSNRMGRDKWDLPFGEKTVLERLVGVLRSTCDEICVVTAGRDKRKAEGNKAECLESRMDLNSIGITKWTEVAGFITIPSIQFIHDEHFEIGPLGGIAAGLAANKGTSQLVVASDMPFPSTALIRELFKLSKSSHHKVIVPEYGGRLHPLFAAYRQDCLLDLSRYIKEGGRKVTTWMQSLESITVIPESRVLELNPDGTALMNMNRPEDYERALSLFAESAASHTDSGVALQRSVDQRLPDYD